MTLKAEVESKGMVEQTLRGYKDEVETLKEALSIAAMSVAEAATEEFGYLTQDEFEALASGEEEENDRNENVCENENALQGLDGLGAKLLDDNEKNHKEDKKGARPRQKKSVQWKSSMEEKEGDEEDETDFQDAQQDTVNE